MESSKFKILIEKVKKQEIRGMDEREYMQYHPCNLREGFFPFEKNVILTNKQKEELEFWVDQKGKEFKKLEDTAKEDDKAFHSMLKPIYWIIGIILFLMFISGSNELMSPGDFSDTLKLDDAKR